MSAADLTALLPLLLLSASSVAVMLAIAFYRRHGFIAGLTLLSLAASFVALWPAARFAPRQVTPLIRVDQFALFYMGLMFAAAFAVVLLAYGYFEKQKINREEFYVLLLLSTVGAAVLVASNHFVSFFLGLEILSVTLYALIAYLTTRRISVEAGIKYLVLAAASAAFLLFGMALVYAELGTMEFPRLARVVAGTSEAGHPLLLAGIALILTGIGFKLGVVPFHLWAPDVYEGAPAPVATFVATVSKGAMFAILLRYFYQSGARSFGAVFLIIAIIAIASMIAGNLLALLQNNVKRILAYSSIAHLGYLLVAFEAGGSVGAAAGTFYLVAYFVTTLGAFGIVSVLSEGERDADRIEDYRGLFWRRPVVAGIFAAMLFSLAGIPLTAGFLGKFFIVAAGASVAIWSLILILVVTSVIGLYYYLRIVVTLFASPAKAGAGTPQRAASLSLAGGGVLIVLVVLLVWFGVYPRPLLDAIQSAIASLV